MLRAWSGHAVAITWLTIASCGRGLFQAKRPGARDYVGALVKVVEGAVKLIDVLIRSVGIGGPNVRGQMAAVTPDFVWALVLTTTLLMVIGLMGSQRNLNSSARPDIRRAA